MSHSLILGIRREDKNRWERRAPLAPSHVRELIRKGITILIQPSTLRTYSDRLYAEAGAIVQEDLSEASTIIAVKEVPVDLLLPNKTYMFFSHTIKAQQDNMPMLDAILEKRIRLIDYERITDNSGRRLVRFGKFAGFAGMIDTFHALGDRLLALGHSTPFLHIGYSYCYSSVGTAKSAVVSLGEEIENHGIPQCFVPFVFVFTSEGHVSKGAQEIFRLLPHRMVSQEELVELVNNKDKASSYLIYGIVADCEHFIEPNDPNAVFSKQDYYAHPEFYHSVFFEKYAPYVSVIMNCMYWDYRYPRIFTVKQVEKLVEENRSRLIAVGDISCDKMGSIEFLMKTTSIDQPLFVYDPLTGEVLDSSSHRDYIYSDGILFLAIDNFPTEFPKEATNWFGDNLLPFIEAVVKSNPSGSYEDQQKELPPEIFRSMITNNGQLTPKYRYIMDIRKLEEQRLRKILLLGAGFVSGPAIEYFCRTPSNYVTVADIMLKLAKEAVVNRRNCQAQFLDIKDISALENLISHHSIVVSLLPASTHPIIAKSCLKLNKNLVTASYISPEMRALHDQVVQKGLIFLNEIGLDPGIDHLEAKRVIDEAKKKGGKIRSFVSWCGGLPMPEASGNPLAYKFSWSPRGVLSAATNDARYLQDGKIIEVPGSTLFKRKQSVNLFPGFSLEGIPNRDATIYRERYGIANEVQTIFRGTLRYKGFCNVMEAVVEIGLLDDKPQPHLAPNASAITWNEALCKLLKAREGQRARTVLRNRLRAETGFPTKGYGDDQIREILAAFEWLEMFSEKQVNRKGTYIDCFCDLLQEKLKYEPNEADMILLHHIFVIEKSNGSWETRSSSLAVHGSKQGMAMARTVGLPVAIATEMILDGEISSKGVLGPMEPAIYNPILRALAKEGIKFVERCSSNSLRDSFLEGRF